MKLLWIIQCIGLLSFIGSVSILILFNSRPILMKKKINSLVFYIAISDLFATLGWIIGESEDGTIKCWFQSMMTSFFPLVSLFYTTLISIILFAVIYKKKWGILYSNEILYGCWIFPLILTLLPLTTNSYGNPGSTSGWCFLDRSHSHRWTLTFWIFFSFYLWFYIAVFLYFLLLWSITYRLSFIYGTLARIQNRSEDLTISRIKKSIRKFIWYPLIIVLCWLPSALWDINEALDESSKMKSFFSRDWDSSYFNMFPASQGLVTSIAFFCTNSDIYFLVMGKNQMPSNEEEDLDPGVGSNLSIWPFYREPLMHSTSLSSRRGLLSINDISSSSYLESESNSVIKDDCSEDELKSGGASLHHLYPLESRDTTSTIHSSCTSGNPQTRHGNYRTSSLVRDNEGITAGIDRGLYDEEYRAGDLVESSHSASDLLESSHPYHIFKTDQNENNREGSRRERIHSK